MSRLLWSVPRKVPAVERFSSSACALSAAEGLVLLSEVKSGVRAPRVPKAAVYYPLSASGDGVEVVTMFTAGNNKLLSPPLHYWTNITKTEYAHVSHAVVFPRDLKGVRLQDCLLVWFTEECMDDRPVSMLAKKLHLTTAHGGFVQGPIVVCSFRGVRQSDPHRYVGKTPMIYGMGQWVHMPMVGDSVKLMSRPSACNAKVSVQEL